MSVGAMPGRDNNSSRVPGLCRDGSFTDGLLISLTVSPITASKETNVGWLFQLRDDVKSVGPSRFFLVSAACPGNNPVCVHCYWNTNQKRRDAKERTVSL